MEGVMIDSLAPDLSAAKALESLLFGVHMFADRRAFVLSPRCHLETGKQCRREPALNVISVLNQMPVARDIGGRHVGSNSIGLRFHAYAPLLNSVSRTTLAALSFGFALGVALPHGASAGAVSPVQTLTYTLGMLNPITLGAGTNIDAVTPTPPSGVGEIGMNLSIYGLGDGRTRSWLAVDLGVSFATEEQLPGIDLILPDISYLVQERKNLAGLVLTHAHEDHFGALLDLWPRLKIPVYATPFTAALLAAKRASEPGVRRFPSPSCRSVAASRPDRLMSNWSRWRIRFRKRPVL